MKLSARMNSIISFIEICDTVADIGTDHGFIPFEIINQSLANKVIATDISHPSLKKTKNLIEKYGLEKKIETRAGDGLSVIKKAEVDYIIIAGMGGILISEILDRSKEVSKGSKLILQPMTGEVLLKEYLYENNYRIIDERLTLDANKFYQTIYAEFAGTKKDINPYISPFWPRDEVFFLYINHMINKYRIIVNGLKISDNKSRLEDSERILRMYEEVLNDS